MDAEKYLNNELFHLEAILLNSLDNNYKLLFIQNIKHLIQIIGGT